MVSKQAVHARLNGGFTRFVSGVVTRAMERVYDRLDRPAAGVFAHFGRVLLQDSTVVTLPARLAEAFPGARNQTGKVRSAMKLQTVFDLKRDRYESVGITAFNRNDQAASPDIARDLRPGDLLIRDLGYFVLSAFTLVAESGAYFLSRLRSNTKLHDPESLEEISLFKLLRKRDALDIDVLVGAVDRIPVRLVARRVPMKVAAERRRQARRNRDKRLKPSAEKLALLDWEIFITNVPSQIWTDSMVCQVYGFRWPIEVLFKTWKSYLQLASLPQSASETQAICLALARILNATTFHAKVWYAVKHGLQQRGTHASILKTMSAFVAPCADRLLRMADEAPEALLEILTKHCSYEKRRRLSHGAIFDSYADLTENRPERHSTRHATNAGGGACILA